VTSSGRNYVTNDVKKSRSLINYFNVIPVIEMVKNYFINVHNNFSEINY